MTYAGGDSPEQNCLAPGVTGQPSEWFVCRNNLYEAIPSISVEWVRSFKDYLNHFRTSHPNIYAEARQHVHQAYGVSLAGER